MVELNTEGCYLAIEGPDGNGKTTQVMLLAPRLEAAFPEKGLALVREPGGTRVGEKIRPIILDKELRGTNEEPTKRTEFLLFSAGRSQLIDETIRPLIKKGRVVLTERYCLSSTVYQGIALGLGEEVVELVNAFATGGCLPDRTFIPIVTPEEVFKRWKKEGRVLDRIESRGLDYHRRVLDGYVEIANRHPDIYKLIDGADTIENVHGKIWQLVLEFMYETNRIDEDRYLSLRSQKV